MINLIPHMDGLCEHPFNLTEKQAYIFVGTIYFFVLLYILLFIVAIINMKGMCERMKNFQNVALFLFYTLVLILIGFRIVDYIFYWRINYDSLIGMDFIPALLKLNMGGIHDWVMTELSIKLSENIMIITHIKNFSSKQHGVNSTLISSEETVILQKRTEKREKRLKIARIVFLSIVVLNVTILSIYYSVYSITHN